MVMSLKMIVPNFILSISLFCLSFFLAWQISATSDFLYSTWYEVLDLDETIVKYAPHNKHKVGFENSDKQQHIELFSGIVNAIQKNGDGLRQLHYTDVKSNKTEALLTDAEVVHLQDVGHLVSKFKYVGVVGLVIAVIVFMLMHIKNISVSRFKRHLFGGVGIVLFIAIIIIIVGPTRIFYLGHELIFPDNHQWFFYYEDSLMSTMMKAPVLFGPVACQLLLLTLLLWATCLYALKQLQSRLKRA